MRFSTVALSVMLITSGCTTPQSLRADRPASSIVSAKPAAVLAECIFPRAIGISEGMNVRRAKIDGIEHITADSGEANLTVYDLAFLPQTGGTLIEIRGARNVWGGTNEPSELKGLIAQCSAG